MSREAKKHWRGRNKTPLCGADSIKYANKKRAVTCLHCQKLLAGFQPK